MTIIATQISRIGFTVERFDSKWIPFEFRMFYCRQPNDLKNQIYYHDWARECVSLMPQFGLNDTFEKMEIGDRRRYWAHVRLDCHQDYWGECDYDMEILKLKRIK